MTPLAAPALTLELLHAKAEAVDRQGSPLVFVHGAFCGAWIWEEHFLPFFASQGREAYAVSLRGHGRSGGHDGLRNASMSDYVHDLATVVRGLDRPPVLIGHSMGGMVVQRYVAEGPARDFARRPPITGMVLMSTVPPGGLLATAADMMLRDPVLFWQIGALQLFGPAGTTAESIHRAMFPPDTPVHLTRHYMNRMQAESLRVQFDMALATPPDATNGRSVPTLVLGAEHDAFVPRWTIEATARHYGTEAVIIENTGHAMMLGPRWERAAEEIGDWLDIADL